MEKAWFGAAWHWSLAPHYAGSRGRNRRGQVCATCMFSSVPQLCNNLILDGNVHCILHPAHLLVIQETPETGHSWIKFATSLDVIWKAALSVTILRNQRYFTAPSELSHLSNVLIQTVQVSPTKFKRIGVFLATLCFTTTAYCWRCVVEPGTSKNVHNVKTECRLFKWYNLDFK